MKYLSCNAFLKNKESCSSVHSSYATTGQPTFDLFKLLFHEYKDKNVILPMTMHILQQLNEEKVEWQLPVLQICKTFSSHMISLRAQHITIQQKKNNVESISSSEVVSTILTTPYIHHKGQRWVPVHFTPLWNWCRHLATIKKANILNDRSLTIDS